MTTAPAAPTAPAPGSPPAAVRSWREPEGINPRGTVLLITGRGESPAVYERFGRRLAADAHRVTAAAGGAGALLDALLTDPGTVRPLVLAGSDTGAREAVALARRTAARGGPALDGLLLAGLPDASVVPGDAPPPPEARTACPAHRRVLQRDASPAPAAAPAPEPAAGPLGVPLLAVHGEHDQVRPLATAAEEYRALGSRQIAVVADGLHDALNDASHRSVAATVVLFLERLRGGAELPAVVREIPAAGDPA